MQHSTPPIPTVKHLKTMRVYILVMTCLAGSIISLLLFIFGIRGLTTNHYLVMLLVGVIMAMVWTVWPTKAYMKECDKYHRRITNKALDSQRVKSFLRDAASMDRPE